jgi:4a-hydroxytetrahydrobiopterin dehydratase
MTRPDSLLSRQQISAAVAGAGWRFVLGRIQTAVAVRSLAQASAVLTHVLAAAGDSAAGRLEADLRDRRVLFTVRTPAVGWVTTDDIDLATTISAAVAELGLTAGPDAGARTVQVVELAIDARDIPSVRPFWKAALAYVDEPGQTGPTVPLVDPAGQGPSLWFQQMDAPREQRNRIHFDIDVPHDEAADRIAAALAAGGRLVYDAEAPAFWVLADPEGNEACICTWQGRDP